MNQIIIIEAPGKLKSIQKYSGLPVFATAGHFKDLPGDAMGVDLDTYEPTFVYSKDFRTKKLKKLQEIKDHIKSKNITEVVIATDPDREGEAIGFFVFDELKKLLPERSFYRAYFREINKKKVEEGLAGKIPFTSVPKGNWYAFLARRIIDRLTGYILSPLAWQALQQRLSVGRVQSPATKIIIEREKAIAVFVPETFWKLSATLTKGNEEFTATFFQGKPEDLHDDTEGEEEQNRERGTTFRDKDFIERVKQAVAAANNASVTDMKREPTKRYPEAPFVTSTLQIKANKILGFSPKLTMSLAQELYQGKNGGDGLITYHRTDDPRVSEDYIALERKAIAQEFGDKYVPEKPFQYKAKSNTAQEGHEAVRPTRAHPVSEAMQVALNDGFSQEHAKLYELICRQMKASQMSPALFQKTTATFDIGGYSFKASGSVREFEGFQAVMKSSSKDKLLPHLDTGETVQKLSEEMSEGKTTPPSLMTEGDLIKELEKLGIGRPSTTAQICDLILSKGYVVMEKKKGHLSSTQTGRTIISWLEKAHPFVVDYGFTKMMEEYLDAIIHADNPEELELHLVKHIHGQMEFYKPDGSERNSIGFEEKEVLGKCPECKEGDVVETNIPKKATFYGCSRYKEGCRFILQKKAKGGVLKDYSLKAEEVKKLLQGEAVSFKHGNGKLEKNGQYWNIAFGTENNSVASSPVDHSPLGKCPGGKDRCGADVYENGTNYYCEKAIGENPTCKLIVYKNQRFGFLEGHSIARGEMETLIYGGRIKKTGLKSKKGKKFNAEFFLAFDPQKNSWFLKAAFD